MTPNFDFGNIFKKFFFLQFKMHKIFSHSFAIIGIPPAAFSSFDIISTPPLASVRQRFCSHIFRLTTTNGSPDGAFPGFRRGGPSQVVAPSFQDQVWPNSGCSYFFWKNISTIFPVCRIFVAQPPPPAPNTGTPVRLQ